MSYDYDDVAGLMAERDDLVVDDGVAGRIAGKSVEFAYMQGYIEAVCEEAGLVLADCEGEYRRIQQVAAHGEYGLDKFCAPDEDATE